MEILLIKKKVDRNRSIFPKYLKKKGKFVPVLNLIIMLSHGRLTIDGVWICNWID
jgi:hypothetical protein